MENENVNNNTDSNSTGNLIVDGGGADKAQVSPQEKVITTQPVDKYKDKYKELFLKTSLKESTVLQALDLPNAIALDYFSKFFEVCEDDKGNVTVAATFNNSKLVDDKGNPVTIDKAIDYIVNNTDELKGSIKRGSGYKGSASIATADIKNMSVKEKLSLRKQIGSSAFRSLLASSTHQ